MLGNTLSPWEVYTDGSCKKLYNEAPTGYGGWAYIILRDYEIVAADHGSVPNTTSQKMELTAIVNALEKVEELKKFYNDEVVVYSDSAYAINCYLKEWYKTWERNGWVNSKGEDVANQHLWRKIIPFFKRKSYTFRKVAGHSGNHFNELCDKEAQECAERLKNARRDPNETAT